jgi:hypothetical protein
VCMCVCEREREMQEWKSRVMEHRSEGSALMCPFKENDHEGARPHPAPAPDAEGRVPTRIKGREKAREHFYKALLLT